MENVSRNYTIQSSFDALPSNLLIFADGPLRGAGVFRLTVESDPLAIESKLFLELGTPCPIRLLTKEYLAFVGHVRLLNGLILGLGESFPRDWLKYQVEIGDRYEVVAFDSQAEPGAMNIVSDLFRGDFDRHLTFVPYEYPTARHPPGTAEGVEVRAPHGFSRKLAVGGAIVALGAAAWFGARQWGRSDPDRALNAALHSVGINSPIELGMSSAEEAIAAYKAKDYERAIRLFGYSSRLFEDIAKKDGELHALDLKLFDLAMDLKRKDSAEFRDLQRTLLEISKFKVAMRELVVDLYPLKFSDNLDPEVRSALEGALDRMR